MAVIPGDCTKYLQPPDVVWSKSFKGNLRVAWQMDAQDEDKEMTSGGNLKTPALLVTWIISAWQEITPEMIRKSFKDCGIINTCDGSEDDLIHCF